MSKKNLRWILKPVQQLQCSAVQQQCSAAADGESENTAKYSFVLNGEKRLLQLQEEQEAKRRKLEETNIKKLEQEDLEKPVRGYCLMAKIEIPNNKITKDILFALAKHQGWKISKNLKKEELLMEVLKEISQKN
eukprot:Pompholyxophrys_punicea_v1_NODE_463_length_1898_cov_5.250136.p1 type:complete len:134 gc:universal NODE_463_length_1898_cov_5.250136:905-504(-)